MPVFEMEMFGAYEAISLIDIPEEEIKANDSIAASPMPHISDAVPGQLGMFKLAQSGQCKANVYLTCDEGCYKIDAVHGKDYEFVLDKKGKPVKDRSHFNRGSVLKIEVD